MGLIFGVFVIFTSIIVVLPQFPPYTSGFSSTCNGVNFREIPKYWYSLFVPCLFLVSSINFSYTGLTSSSCINEV